MNNASTATKTLQHLPVGRLLLVVVLVLAVAAWWIHYQAAAQFDQQLHVELSRKRTLAVVDSIERCVAARHRRDLDSVKALYQTRRDHQARRYVQQQKRDQDLERRYRALSPLVLPEFPEPE